MWIACLLLPFTLSATPHYHKNCELSLLGEHSWRHEQPILEEAGYEVVQKAEASFENVREGTLALEAHIEDGRCGLFCVRGVVTYHLYEIEKDHEPKLVKRVKKGMMVPFGQGNRLVDMLKSAVQSIPTCVVREDPSDPVGKGTGHI